MSGAIIDAISEDAPGRLLIADNFAGGGVIALAALLRGHQVYAQDVNPWAARSLATMLDLPAADDILAAGDRVREQVEATLDAAYATTLADGTPATIAHTLRVATAPCPRCERTLRLYPTGLVSLLRRVDCGGSTGYVACPEGHLTLAAADRRTSCTTCGRYVKPTARYTANRIARCINCRWTGKLSDLAQPTGFSWEVALVERAGAGRREIAPPTAQERAQAADENWEARLELAEIASGVETSVLLRHGMIHWHHLYPNRQRAVLEALLEVCSTDAEEDPRLTRTLEAAVIASSEMAGRASRWDARYLKPYEAVANHRFNFTTLAAEPNVWGARESGRGTVSRRLEHFAKASVWLDERTGRPLKVLGPKKARGNPAAMSRGADALIVSGSSERIQLPDNSVDGLVTDPPYHDDVHYAELSDLFRAWAGQSTGALPGDAIVGRVTTGHASTEAYQVLLTDVFTEMRRVLKPGGHLVLSYANRHPSAWVALLTALQSAGFWAAGFTVVHSENEVDHAKAGRRACTLDVLMDLTASATPDSTQHRPSGAAVSDEEEFCRAIGTWALKIGNLPDGWAEKFIAQVEGAVFLATR